MGITDDWKYLENNSILSSGRYHCISAIYPRTFIRWLDSYIKLPYTILYFLITTIIFTLLSLPLAFSLLPPTLTIKNFFIQLYPAIVLFSCFVILNLLIYSFYKEIFNQIYQEGQIFPAYSGNIPFNLEGIPLTAILEFIEQCGGRDQLINLTTSDVCEKYLKPLTKLSNQSYCSYLKDQLHDSRVKQANIFVSHAWRYKFLDVVDALIEHFPNNSMNKEPPILWFDLFSNNQHLESSCPPFEWWCHTFLNAIKSIGTTVMIISPWENPITLTRVWCLWELFCTYHSKSKFEVAFCINQKVKFHEELLKNPEIFLNMLSNIDINKAEAMKKEDKERIFFVIEKTLGFQQLNAAVIECLSEWCIRELLESLSSPDNTVELKIKKLNAIATIFHSQGMYDFAQRYYQEVIDIYQNIKLVTSTNAILSELWITPSSPNSSSGGSTTSIVRRNIQEEYDLNITKSFLNLLRCQLAEEKSLINPSVEKMQSQLHLLITLNTSLSQYITIHYPNFEQGIQQNCEIYFLQACLLHLIGKLQFELQDYPHAESNYQSAIHILNSLNNSNLLQTSNTTPPLPSSSDNNTENIITTTTSTSQSTPTSLTYRIQSLLPDLALLYTFTDRPLHVLDLYMKLIIDDTTQYGFKHVYTLQHYFNLSYNLFLLGLINESKAINDVILKLVIIQLGSGNPLTTKFMEHTADVLCYNLKEYNEAFHLYYLVYSHQRNQLISKFSIQNNLTSATSLPPPSAPPAPAPHSSSLISSTSETETAAKAVATAVATSPRSISQELTSAATSSTSVNEYQLFSQNYKFYLLYQKLRNFSDYSLIFPYIMLLWMFCIVMTIIMNLIFLSYPNIQGIIVAIIHPIFPISSLTLLTWMKSSSNLVHLSAMNISSITKYKIPAYTLSWSLLFLTMILFMSIELRVNYVILFGISLIIAYCLSPWIYEYLFFTICYHFMILPTWKQRKIEEYYYLNHDNYIPYEQLTEEQIQQYSSSNTAAIFSTPTTLSPWSISYSSSPSSPSSSPPSVSGNGISMISSIDIESPIHLHQLSQQYSYRPILNTWGMLSFDYEKQEQLATSKLSSLVHQKNTDNLTKYRDFLDFLRSYLDRIKNEMNVTSK